jgi:hypothetical protein
MQLGIDDDTIRHLLGLDFMMIRADKFHAVRLAISRFLIGRYACVHRDDDLGAFIMNEVFDGIHIEAVSFIHATGDVVDVIPIADRLKEPDPADAAHRAVNVVIGVERNALFFFDGAQYGRACGFEAVIAVIKLVGWRVASIALTISATSK